MSLELAFVLAMPAMLAVLIIWMIASGQTRTGAIGPGEPNPYPERIDTFGRWLLGIVSALVYIAIAVAVGPLAAAVVFAILLVIDVVGAFIWTCIQEARGRHSVPFGTRLFRNVRDFYASIVCGVLQFG
jgi:hypothetical protein